MVDWAAVMVFARNRLQIHELATETVTGSRTSWLHLVVGVVRYVVAKGSVVLAGAHENEFAISTATAVAGVSGTDGIITHFPSQGS